MAAPIVGRILGVVLIEPVEIGDGHLAEEIDGTALCLRRQVAAREVERDEEWAERRLVDGIAADLVGRGPRVEKNCGLREIFLVAGQAIGEGEALRHGKVALGLDALVANTLMGQRSLGVEPCSSAVVAARFGASGPGLKPSVTRSP